MAASLASPPATEVRRMLRLNLRALVLGLLLIPSASFAHDPRCGTWLLQAAPSELDAEGRRLREELVRLDAQARAKVAQTFDSPGGHFVIEYDDTVVDPTDGDSSGVPDYVEWVAEAMDESWDYTVDTLGYPAPPLGAGERYRVSLQLSSFYGFTTTSGSPPGGTRIVINGDFEGFYAARPGLHSDDPDGPVRGAIRVTAVHEFKHASQFIESSWSESGAWNEVDATWMEDMGYDQVNDYYNYLTGSSSPFVAPSVSLNAASYDDSTWQHYLAQRYGVSLLRDFGDRRATVLVSENPERSFRAAAEARGIDWLDLWREYGVWNYLSGDRATASVGFDEAAFYPTSSLAAAVVSYPFESPPRSLPWLAFAFHEYDPATHAAGGNLLVSFAGQGAEWTAALVFQNATQTEWRAVPMTTAGEGVLSVDDLVPADFERIALLVGNATTGTTGSTGSYEFAFGVDITDPRTFVRMGVSPFAAGSPTSVSFSTLADGPASIEVFDLRGRRVRELLSRRTLAPGVHGPYDFDGRDDGGKTLASGVYLVAVQAVGIDEVRRVVFLK